MSLSLSTAGLGILSYLVAHLIHLMVWCVGKHHKLLDLFHILLIIPSIIYLNVALKLGFSNLLIPWTIHALLAANYLAIFPAFQASSPTIRILDHVWKKQRPIPTKELVEKFGTGEVIAHRMADLVQGGLVDKEKKLLSFSANAIATFFIAYRKFLGLPVGKG